jgi:hypothetical protein
MGKAVGISVLDLAEKNPWTRLTNCEFMTLEGLRIAV